MQADKAELKQSLLDAVEQKSLAGNLGFADLIGAVLDVVRDGKLTKSDKPSVQIVVGEVFDVVAQRLGWNGLLLSALKQGLGPAVDYVFDHYVPA